MPTKDMCKLLIMEALLQQYYKEFPHAVKFDILLRFEFVLKTIEDTLTFAEKVADYIARYDHGERF